MSNKIFIQIASYRDNQLLPTLRDCISKATHPENLVFGICWQHSKSDQWDTLTEYKNDKRFRIIDVDYSVSKGACWARNSIQQLYKGEEYTLQLDSHHRFVNDWDTELIKMYKQLKNKGYSKPLLTTYLPSFDPETDPKGRSTEPCSLAFDRFTPEGVVFFTPRGIPNYQNLTEPVPCRFYSAHFCFTSGSFCKEVQHDPEYYFHGEEISIAVRAYTHGYDLFTPHKLIAWHEYTRRYRKKHWDDNSNWTDLNTKTYVRLKNLLGIDGANSRMEFGKYGLGTERLLSDYENYAGVRFSDRSVQQYTLDNNYAPNPNFAEPFICVFKHCIDIHKSRLATSASTGTSYDFVAVIFEDSKGKSMHREDMNGEEFVKALDQHDGFYKIWRTFTYLGERPQRCIIWPYSKTLGWCDRIEENVRR